MKVENFYNKNQFIIKGNNGEIVFQSYDSEIANIDTNGRLVLGRRWDYSNTTKKHLYLFLNDYFYQLNNDTQNLLKYLDRQNNKRLFIQNLIDNKKINYNEDMI